MPRAGKKAANQHNTRHENGVVAPGKRITKQKSNGHLNGNPAASVPSHVLSSVSSPDAPPSTQLPGHVHSRVASGAKLVRDRAGSATKSPVVTSGELSEDPEFMGNGSAHANGSLDKPHRKIDVNAVKSPAVHDNTIFSLALTILKSCPLGDTIAILIFLLSLPPTLISVTNALFAVLTFMPPAGSFSSIPTTFNDVFQGSGGTPSLATILVTDILGIVIWLVAWSPLQALGLELAQAVVATTLGGGNSSQRTGSDSTLFCMLIVLSTHVARQKWVPKRIFGYEWSVRLASISYIPEHFSGEFVHEDHQPRSVGGWFRILIALHILIQGLVHVARRWYTKREYPQTSKNCKKVDPEAGGPSQITAEAVSTTLNGFSELISKASLPISKESRDKISYGKKRRKQGTYVRSQQPLWAAFAATKVTVLREMEQSHALSEALGSNATDTKNLGNAPFVTEEGRVWITLVQPNSFFFDASYFSFDRGNEEAQCTEADLPVSPGIDRSKPFFVRINGADWTSSRIDRVSTESSKDGSAGRQWTGEVYGLSPCSSYNCSFVRSEDGVIIHSAVVSTPSSPAAERGMGSMPQSLSTPLNVDFAELSAGLASPPQPAVRPSSPTTPSTTLKKSIAAYQASLSESQARQKRNKKEHKATAQLAKKEIEKLNATIARQNEAEKSHSSRQLQLSQHCKQAEEALTSITEEIDSLGNVPEEETEHWKAKKVVWDEQREELDAAKEDHVRCKAAAHQESQAVEAEASTTQQKRERLQARKVKLNEQYARLESANSQELDDMGRKEAEYAARLAQQRQDEERSNEQMALLNRRIQEKHFQTQQCLQQAEMLAAAYYAQQSVELAVESDGAFGEQDPNGAIAQGLAPSNFGGRLPVFPPPENVGIPNALGSFGQGTRPRSSSLLAGSTPYADFLDQDPAPPMPPAQAMRLFRGRQQSGSSGSGSNGSHRDPSSPVSAIGSRQSPVVKKGSPVWN
ncbi:MAG: hypothetical protein L6R37_003386 [Teloschistes peruensis]|nr:MAG: hypothetical protein L6R37_003386 [Teloschistes peruensis]